MTFTLRMGPILLLSAYLCACSAPSPFAPASPVSPMLKPDSLVAHPSKINFGLGDFISPPQSVVISPASSSRFTVHVADPTQVGVAMIATKGSNAAEFLFYPISRGKSAGATVVTILTKGGSVRVPVTQALCGRPENVVHADLIFPKRGATGVDRAIGALYFALYSVVAIGRAQLHLVTGNHGTLEGSALAAATPPPGSVIPTPPPGPFVATYVKGTIPPLPSAMRIGTQVYDDNCQPPVIAGGFTSK